MKKVDAELGDCIIELAINLLKLKVTSDMVERQFFFNFWSLGYLKKLRRLEKLISSEYEPKEYCKQIVQVDGISSIQKRDPQIAKLLGTISKRYGIEKIDILQHIIGNLPLSGYTKYEYYAPENNSMKSVVAPLGSAIIIINDPSKRDVAGLNSLASEYFPEVRRKHYVSNHIRTCTCACLVDRAKYKHVEAIKRWNDNFPRLAYTLDEQGNRVTQPGEIQFSREKRKLIQRFKLIDTGKIDFIQSIP
jgi:hypothetical protein